MSTSTWTSTKITTAIGEHRIPQVVELAGDRRLRVEHVLRLVLLAARAEHEAKRQGDREQSRNRVISAHLPLQWSIRCRR